MGRTIAELWNGNLAPIRDYGAKNAEMKQLEQLPARNLEQLDRMLNESARELLGKCCDCAGEYSVVITEQAFCCGFRLGLRIAAEGLTDDAAAAP